MGDPSNLKSAAMLSAMLVHAQIIIPVCCGFVTDSEFMIAPLDGRLLVNPPMYKIKS
jgi:hypothetical protein